MAKMTATLPYSASSMEYIPGQVVSLKSGGPALTALIVGDTALKCGWFDNRGKYRMEFFPIIALYRVEQEEIGLPPAPLLCPACEANPCMCHL